MSAYHAKRDFAATPEPRGNSSAEPGAKGKTQAPVYVIQKHDATRLHYDFRLELDGVLLSWAVPKGPSLDPSVKRMAVRTEDHPLGYAEFEGTIPPQHYGAGEVIVWDSGSWTPHGDARQGLADGKLGFELHGHKLHGAWELVRLKDKSGEKASAGKENWLLFKKRDDAARASSDYEVLTALPDSVLRRATKSRGHAAPAAAASASGSASASAAPTLPAQVEKKPPTKLPETLSPQLATLASALPGEGLWIIEDKFDGYRMLARIEDGSPQLFTRNGHDWTERLQPLADEIASLRLKGTWLDGEIVVRDAKGNSDFNALQNAFDCQRTQAVHYLLFDLPFFEGQDLRDTPLSERRELLQGLLGRRHGAHLEFSATLAQGDAAAAQRALAQACANQREGVICKRVDAPYRSARGTAWLKLKCQLRQEFVIGGYTLRGDDAHSVGSLILGVYDGRGALRHAGSVGTGWDRKSARELLQSLQSTKRVRSPFASAAAEPANESASDEAATAAPRSGRWPRRSAGEEHWVQPNRVAEIAFAQWTPAGHIRHAVFVALREDKPARAIRRETAAAPDTLAASSASSQPTAKARKKAVAVASTAPAVKSRMAVKVTHPERVIDISTGATKLDLLRYYDSVADDLLPQLRGRPLALLRAPAGVAHEMFFQKHAGASVWPGMKVLDAALWPGHEPLLELRTRAALLAAAQLNAVEFHTWNSTVADIDHPDRLILDLDPGTDVTWAQVREGAELTRVLLQELGLKSWLKTSGGKGLHLVVPILPRWTFDTVKALSKAMVEHLALTLPQRFVAKSGPRNRVGRIFVDYLRNGEGATTVAAYSARARPGLGVSMPLDWDELGQVKSAAAWSIADARDHLSLRKADPWRGLARSRQSLARAFEVLQVQAGAPDAGH